tara:strand:- start:129 stop:548 length:420 start_codon:yes stop_codon:yes gene_type:complete
MNLIIERLDPSLPMPTYAREGDSAMDLYAAKDMDLGGDQRGLMPLGIKMNIPNGYEVQIRPRSGLTKMCLDVKFGTVDSGYRGELMTNIHNCSGNTAKIKKGMRICQAVLAPVTRANIVEGTVNTDTERGEGGFGSTGR